MLVECGSHSKSARNLSPRNREERAKRAFLKYSYTLSFGFLKDSIGGDGFAVAVVYGMMSTC